jgi:DNA modification methylase
MVWVKGAMLNPCQTIGFGGDGPPNRLVLADNLAVTGALADRSLDLVYLDPPFATGQPRRGRRGRFGDGEGDPARLARWLEPRLAEVHRLLAPTGSLFVHLDYRAVHHVKVALDRVFGPARFVNEIVWCYSVGGKSRRSFGRKHDTILWSTATRWPAARSPRTGGPTSRP